MSFNTLLFNCSICQRDIRDWPHRNGRDRHLDPICRLCERWWTERIKKPGDGSMMDRRKAMHVIALSNALHNTASLIEWNRMHGQT